MSVICRGRYHSDFRAVAWPYGRHCQKPIRRKKARISAALLWWGCRNRNRYRNHAELRKRGTDAHFRTIGNDVGIEHPLRHRVLALDPVERRDGMGGADLLLAGFEIVPTTAPKPGSAADTYSRCLQAGPPRSMRAKPSTETTPGRSTDLWLKDPSPYGQSRCEASRSHSHSRVAGASRST